MVGQLSFFGMFFPVLLATSLVAFCATKGVSLLLAKKGLYRYIWHPPLFDLALFLVILGLLISFTSAYKF